MITSGCPNRSRYVSGSVGTENDDGLQPNPTATQTNHICYPGQSRRTTKVDRRATQVDHGGTQVNHGG